MAADKFNSDSFMRNTDYAIIGGITNEEINSLEKELVESMEYDFYVSDSKYSKYHENLLAFASKQQHMEEETRIKRIQFTVKMKEKEESKEALSNIK